MTEGLGVRDLPAARAVVVVDFIGDFFGVEAADSPKKSEKKSSLFGISAPAGTLCEGKAGCSLNPDIFSTARASELPAVLVVRTGDAVIEEDVVGSFPSISLLSAVFTCTLAFAGDLEEEDAADVATVGSCVSIVSCAGACRESIPQPLNKATQKEKKRKEKKSQEQLQIISTKEQ